jgi:hypothetical protein
LRFDKSKQFVTFFLLFFQCIRDGPAQDTK